MLIYHSDCKTFLLHLTIFYRLEELESDLQVGDLTTKGYCRKKWKLLEPHVELNVTEQISKLQTRLEATKLSEVRC